jgi:signal transduction histidine kinase/DNA-binding response OmpR family regulator
MKIKITPPFWARWWAYLIYVVIIVLLSRWFYRFKVSKKIAIAESVRLKEINEIKNTLYTNITHEFRTPLTVIQGMTDSLKLNIENKEFSEAERSLEMIHRNNNNLLQLVNEILDISKIESGTMYLHLTQSNSIIFLKYLSESFSSLATQSEINLTIYSEIDELVMDFDPNKLSVIVSNLLSNAIKFTPAGGKIIVHLNKEIINNQPFFSIKVKDTGQGISEEHIANIFNRFYQVDCTISRKQEGTGIGLAITKEFVTLMNGSITVNSIPQKGTTFSVKLPITNNALLEKETQVSSRIDELPKPLYTETKLEQDSNAEGLPLVLIIEDNLDVAHYLKICLKDHYQTIHAVDGSIGIDIANQKIPDIIISDVMMPNKSGYEVCDTLKTNELTSHIPIILLTAKTTIHDRIAGLSHGADAYLTKPFVKEELFTRLDQLISLRKKMLAKFGNSNVHELLHQKVETPDEKFLQKVVTIIHNHIASETFNTAMLAHKLQLSESQVYRKLKAISNKSTAVFIRSIRLQKGKELIETTNKNISEIAYEIGFNDPSWFTRAFKEEFGLTPNAMRK